MSRLCSRIADRVAVGVGLDDTARPQHVVADVEPADADPLAAGAPGVRVPVLVDVVVDDVELAIDGGHLLDRVADVIRHAVEQPRARQVVLALRGVAGIAVGAVHLAVAADRAREPVGAVAEPAPELHHAAGADRTREHLERYADVASDDRESALATFRLHLEQDRLVVPGLQRRHVRLDLGVHDVHATTLRRTSAPRPTDRLDARMTDDRFATDSGIELQPVYEPDPDFDPSAPAGEPGAFPFTRGPYPTMYRGRLWTMRQYAGMGTADDTNRRFRYLLEHGQTGLSTAFDLPTQMGLDSDHPRAEGEVGKTGVAIDSHRGHGAALRRDPARSGLDVDDDQRHGADPAAALRAGRRRTGASRRPTLSGTVQNDILKEYAARGTYIYPPEPVDAADHRPVRLLQRAHPEVEHDLDQRLPHARGRARRPRRRSRSRSRTGSRTCRRRSTLGSRSTTSRRGCRSSSRAISTSSRRSRSSARRGACGRGSCASGSGRSDERSLMLRFHTQTGGATLTAQQPENNIVRTALEALSAVLGGTQSLHTNAFDEALALPTEACRQDRAAHPAGDRLRDRRRRGGRSARRLLLRGGAHRRAGRLATAYIEKVDGFGGAVAAIEQGFYQDEIHEAAFRIQQAIERGDRVVVGVNRFQEDETANPSFSGSARMRSRRRSPGCANSVRRGISRGSTPRSRTWGRRHGGRPTSCRRCGRPCGRARRSARSPTCCATCSASTGRRTEPSTTASPRR